MAELNIEVRDLPEVDFKGTGKKIKEQMRKCKMDHFDLALLLRMRTTSSIYAWTQGRHIPNSEYLLQLANIFGCRMEDLLAIKGEYNEDEYNI